jgi:hypothetical protein
MVGAEINVKLIAILDNIPEEPESSASMPRKISISNLKSCTHQSLTSVGQSQNSSSRNLQPPIHFSQSNFLDLKVKSVKINKNNFNT